MSNQSYIRQFAEEKYTAELAALIKEDQGRKPENWAMSPAQVLTYIQGGKTKKGMIIEPKYFGQQRLIEIAIATLLTDRALLLIGIPGTAKTWLSEHLSAAISGSSKLLVQGTSGTSEDAIRYGWNYAKLLQEGPSDAAMVASPVMRAMVSGQIVRVEELTRIPADIQDALITILSEKSMPVPELGIEIRAKKGFNLIATANDRDKGIHDLSSALQRRFNTLRLPLPATLQQEVEIVQYRVKELSLGQDLPKESIAVADIRKLIMVFRELRSGQSDDGEVKLKSPSATLSTAEAISAVNSSQHLMTHFGDSYKSGYSGAIAESIIGAAVKDEKQDANILREYLEAVMRKRKGWKKLYDACKAILNA